MDFTFNIYTDSNAGLPRQLLANNVTKQELSRFKFQPTRHCQLFDVLSVTSDTVGVAWLCLLFTISCSSVGQALKTIYNRYFLMQNQIWIWSKIVSVHPIDSVVGKLLDIDNIRTQNPSHP